MSKPIKKKPIATIMREVLIENDSWDRFSITYQDKSYTKTTVKTTWKSKQINKLSERKRKIVEKEIVKRLQESQYNFDLVCCLNNQVIVTQTNKIKI